MNNSTDETTARLNALIDKLTPQARRTLARKIGVAIRKRQQENIKNQQNPDGTPFQKRKKYKGRVKNKAMFLKLRQAKFMRLKTTTEQAEIGFKGRAGTIAKRHQNGEKVGSVKLPKRELLGVTEQEQQIMRNIVIESLI